MFGKVLNATLHKLIIVCNQFKPNVPFLDPLKTLESQKRGIKTHGVQKWNIGLNMGLGRFIIPIIKRCYEKK